MYIDFQLSPSNSIYTAFEIWTPFVSPRLAWPTGPEKHTSRVALAAGELGVLVKKKVAWCSLRNTPHGVKSRWAGGKARQQKALGDPRRRKRRTKAEYLSVTWRRQKYWQREIARKSSRLSFFVCFTVLPFLFYCHGNGNNKCAIE